MTNKEIRENLIKYAHAFLDKNCQYWDGEPMAVVEMLNSLHEPEDDYEEFNAKHPDHGNIFLKLALRHLDKTKHKDK